MTASSDDRGRFGRKCPGNRPYCAPPIASEARMPDLFDNPLGTDGFEFVEFTSPDPETLGRQFETMGFTAVARHRSKAVVRYRQGDINFLVNMEPKGQVAAFRERHGPSANAMAFRVKDA